MQAERIVFDIACWLIDSCYASPSHDVHGWLGIIESLSPLPSLCWFPRYLHLSSHSLPSLSVSVSLSLPWSPPASLLAPLSPISLYPLRLSLCVCLLVPRTEDAFGFNKNLFRYKIKTQWKFHELTNKLAYTRWAQWCLLEPWTRLFAQRERMDTDDLFI